MKMVKKRYDLARTIALASIVICVLAVTAYSIYALLYRSVDVAQTKMDEYAKSYYTEYLYPNFVDENKDKTLLEAFKSYIKPGFPIVKLRQIINYYRFDRKEDIRSYFETDDYVCDTNNSSIIYKPYSPFGPTDVEIITTLSCDKN